MNSVSFHLIKPTLNSLVLLEGNGIEPVGKPTPIYCSNRKVGKILETIGRVENPIYVARLEPNETAGKLAGRKLTINK